ncbi:MAG: Purple acid Phosphatase, N-terminal domain [Blastocatellia bacterium]|nr:Purple acid Phosphatase, N-terminal domain [Blastocatellia bacterium]
MYRQHMILAMIVMLGGLLYSTPVAAQVSPTTKRAANVRITKGPMIERADSYLTIVRWESNNPGGSPVHYGIVRFGTDPRNLSQTAQSPIRLNPSHPTTVFRVRIDGLKSGTTYYYTVDSMEANGKKSRLKSPVKKFTTS